MPNILQIISTLFLFFLSFSFNCFAVEELSNKEKYQNYQRFENDLHSIVDSFRGLSISGQTTIIYQSSSLKLKSGSLKDTSGNNLSESELQKYNHKDGSGSFSADIILEKRFDKNSLLHFDVQFANGQGVDVNLQGGSMVNNDIMENPQAHNEVYLAKGLFQKKIYLPEDYNITFNIGKFGVNDFFDVGDENSDQSTQFLNQAVANNGAFDYVQDLEGHGYTYGFRSAISNDLIGFDFGFFSSDSYLDNINKRHSLIAAITLSPTLLKNLQSTYQLYAFSNRGEYGSFDGNGNFMTKNEDIDGDGIADNINTADNKDSKNKNGFGISLTQPVSDRINIFAKFGMQDNDRDVRHSNDQDQSFMLGGNFDGKIWLRTQDQVGLAYAQAKLTGNHRKAHEKGYRSFFDRENGIGQGNYRDEYVFESYYRLSTSKSSSISLDYQRIFNFNYSKLIGDVDFFALRFNASF